MQPPLPEPASQRLIGAVLLLLAALGVILLFQDLNRHPRGASRIAWPAPTTVRP
jgi:hypothetical protein